MGCKGVAFGVAFGLALGLAMLTWADDEFIGQWTVKQAYQDREFVSTLTIGETSGTWTSRRGVSQLSKVNNTDGKLTFIRTFSRRGEEFTLDCEATIVDGKLVGKLATQMGDREFTATHVDTKPAVDPSGTWRWAHQDPASGKTVKNVLTIKSTGGDVSGSGEMSGAAFVVNNVIFDGNTLTWDHDLDVDGQALHLGFRGDISGDDLSGAVTLGDLGDFPWAAKRDSKVPADPSGTWRWEHMDPGTGQMIENALTLKVADGEVGGTFEMDGVTYQVNDPEVEGDTVSWDFDFGADGQYINISFYGHISGDSITGSFSVLRNRLEEEGRNQGTREFIRVLRLLEKHSITKVSTAIEKALRLRRCNRDVVANYLYPDEPHLPPTFHLDGREHLQGIVVQPPDVTAYGSLLGRQN